MDEMRSSCTGDLRGLGLGAGQGAGEGSPEKLKVVENKCAKHRSSNQPLLG